MPNTLITIPVSHFCEKARWALQRAGVPFEESANLQLFHMRAVRSAGGAHSVPALVCDEERFFDSSDIVEFADRQLPEPSRLLPADPALRAEVQRWADLFDAKLGPATRRVAYYYLLPRKRLVLDSSRVGAPRYQQLLADLMYPAFSAMMRRGMRINAAGFRRSLAVIERVFDAVGQHLQSGERYLVGGRFTAAELGFAALSAPAVLPPQYGSKLPALGELPSDYRSLVTRLRQHRAGEFALELYSHRASVVG